MGSCLSSEPKLNPNRVDETHFELYRVVGRGAFGKVNCVLHKPSGHLLAMKSMSKRSIIENKQQRVVWIERDVMSQLTSPFLVNLKFAFQNKTKLLIVMPFMAGGDFQYHIDKHGAMSEYDVKFYAAEMLLGLEELHSLSYIYRDLKPANILLDEQGHLRISDFGLVKKLTADKNYTTTGYAGTRGYTAPEVENNKPYGFGVDFWSYGIVIYQLLHNHLPHLRFKEEKKHVDFEIKSSLSPEAVSFLRGLLTYDPKQRLGYSDVPGKGWEAVKHHPWLDGIEWVKVLKREYKPPHTPKLGVANCSPKFEAEDQLLNYSEDREPTLDPDQQTIFDKFSFNCEIENELAHASDTPLTEIMQTQATSGRSSDPEPPKPVAVEPSPAAAAAPAVAAAPAASASASPAPAPASAAAPAAAPSPAPKEASAPSASAGQAPPSHVTVSSVSTGSTASLVPPVASSSTSALPPVPASDGLSSAADTTTHTDDQEQQKQRKEEEEAEAGAGGAGQSTGAVDLTDLDDVHVQIPQGDMIKASDSSYGKLNEMVMASGDVA